MSKKYFWLKLQHDFFERDEIKIIESMDNGKDYIIFYMKLLLKSIKTEGELRLSDTIPYNEKMLATITDTNIDIVRSALNMLIELHLMEKWSDATLYMNETNNMIGTETDAAIRMRRYRERKAMAEGEETPQLEAGIEDEGIKEDDTQLKDVTPVTKKCNNVTEELQPVTNSYTEIEKELELELDIEKEKKVKKDPLSIVPIDDYKFQDGSIELNLAKKMREIMLEIKPDRKDIPDLTTKGLQTWSQHIDYMIRLDERDPMAIIHLFSWSQDHDFWQMNIKSPASLRKQWDRLEMQLAKDQRTNKGSTLDNLKNINAQLQQGGELDNIW